MLPSPLLKEISEILLPETLQNGLVLLFYIVVIPSPWVKQNHNVYNLLKKEEEEVEENFGIRFSKRLQNGLNLLCFFLS